MPAKVMKIKPSPILVQLREADKLIQDKIKTKVETSDSQGLINLIRAKYHIAEAELQILGGSD
jgi:hypothetical protein